MTNLTKRQRSEQWKKDNDWGLSLEQKSEKRAARAMEVIKERITKGKDASVLIELFTAAYGYNPVEQVQEKQDFPAWMEYLSFEQRKRIPGYFQKSDIT